MKYAAAFSKLGYVLDNPRNEWSAEVEAGICISLWKKELAIENQRPYFDLWDLHPDGGDWTRKPGHGKRTRHLQRAVDEFDGRVDVVLVSGEPGRNHEDADPWQVTGRGGYWKITRLDPDTGYFRAEIIALPRGTTKTRK